MQTADLLPILSQFAALDDGAGPQPAAQLVAVPLTGGLINDTFALGQRFILQRLHPLFLATVNQDIAALVPILASYGVPVPQLVPARDGQPCVTWPDGPAAGVWRMLTRLPGQTLHRLGNPQQARAAGAMVGEFHSALIQTKHGFAFTRPGAHDTAKHMQLLTDTLALVPDHRLHAQVAPLAEEVLARWAGFGPLPVLPVRIIHGDLKVSNLLFDGDAVCGVLDLDTMAHSSLDIELGDALRSWCNATTEDDPHPRFEREVFAQALAGYLPVAQPWLQPEERAALAPAVLRICLELSARFLADALRESYFGWDKARFAQRGEHNLLRGANQLGLARDVAAQMPELLAIAAG